MNHSSLTSQLSTYPCLSSKSEMLTKIRELLKKKSGGYYLALNPEKLFTATQNPQIHMILNQSKFLFVDGVGAQWAYRKLLNKDMELVNGVDLMIDTLQALHDQGFKIGLFGSKEDVVQAASENLKRRFPNIILAFAMSGYDDGRNLIEQTIHTQKPDIVFVALGSPEQEKWIHANHQKFPSTLFTGVGGSFDVISGKVRRAPRFIRNMRLEWLYRFASEPLKRWKRMVTLWKFFRLVKRTSKT